jgi:hypothetical protein
VEAGWGEKSSHILRFDLSPSFRAVSLFREGVERPVETFGTAGSRIPAAPSDPPPGKRWSLLGDLPSLSAVEGDLVPFMTGGISGVDPVLARALSDRLGAEPERLLDVLEGIRKDLGENNFLWNVYDLALFGRGGSFAVYPIALPLPIHEDGPEGMTAALRLRAETVVVPAWIEKLRSGALSGLRRRLKKTKRILAGVEGDLEAAARSGELRHMGNLLVTWRHLLRTGMKEIKVKDYSGHAVTIPLDSSLDPERNIRLYFKRAKKGEKGMLIIRERRSRIREEVSSIESRIKEISGCADPAVLVRLNDRAGRKKSGGTGAVERRSLRSYRLDDRHVMLVGRTGRENDELTHRIASPGDLWFHAQGCPGSHVILRGAGRSTPKKLIRTAAETAAWFSKARSSGTVAVVYTEKRYVRRPRGSKPGTAATLRSKTIFVTPKPPPGE